MEYDKIDPFGAARDDLRAALLGVRIAQVMGAKDARLEQFLLDFNDEEIAGAHDADMEKRAAMLNMLFGGRDLRVVK